MAHIEKRDGRKKPFLVGWRDPATKKMRWKSFTHKGKADAYKDEVSTEFRKGTYVDRRPIAVKAYALNWLVRTQPTVSDAAQAYHKRAITKYIVHVKVGTHPKQV